MIKDGQKAEIKEIDKKRYSLNRRIKNLRERYLYKKITEREFCSLIIPLEDELDCLNLKRKALIKMDKDIDFLSLSVREKKSYIHSRVRKITVDTVNKAVKNIVYKDIGN